MAKKEDLQIKAEASTVENDKTKAQKEAAKKTEAAMKNAEKKAKQAQIDADEEAKKKKAAQEKAAADAKEKKEKEAQKKKKESDDSLQALATSGLSLAQGALKGKKKKGFLSGIIIGFVCGALLGGVLVFSKMNHITQQINDGKDTVDEVLTETFAGYTAADFQDAILGEASQHQELIVMEQPLSIKTTLTKSGLGNLAIFSKTKDVTYYGTGVYTVSLKSMDKEHIQVDEDKKVVTVLIPHTVLQYVNYDIDKTEFEDTEKGLLSFGDITLTQEQQQTLEKSINDAMREELNKEDLYALADNYAKLKTWEVFQPLISSVSNQYTVQMEFEDTK